MANLRDLRLRMRAIEQTLQVTKAMDLISTAKLRKGRRAREDIEPYFERIKKSMFDILSCAHDIDSPFFQRPDGTVRTAIIAITSDKGLAGGYNMNIVRHVNDLCSRVKNPVLILIGNIGERYFTHSPYSILENFSFRSQLPTLENAAEIAEHVISQFLWGAFHEAHVVYTHMFSAIKLMTMEQQILPPDKEKIQSEIFKTGGVKRVELQFEFLPSAGAVFDALVPLYVRGVLYGAMVEAYASEQSARMAAMDEASKNAEDMLASLRISYNRARQAGITQEVSEIVGSSVALADK